MERIHESETVCEPYGHRVPFCRYGIAQHIFPIHDTVVPMFYAASEPDQIYDEIEDLYEYDEIDDVQQFLTKSPLRMSVLRE